MTLAISVVIHLFRKARREDERLQTAYSKYPGETVVRIVKKELWKDQTAEELRDSWGAPPAIDVKA